METRAAVGGVNARAPAPSASGGDTPWHALPAGEVLQRLRSAAGGLEPAEAARRLGEHGPNELRQQAAPRFLGALLRQFESLIVWLLIGAAALSGALGDWVDFAVIAAIVVLNAVIGALQEHGAERSIAALRRLTAPQAKVRRAGRTLAIAAAEVVPGDVLVLEAGDLVAADARLLEAASLSCVEKTLTGESEPAEKSATGAIAPRAPLAERATMVFTGTTVATGTARSVVVATGMRTEVGRIAELLETAAPSAETPLQARLRRVGRMLVLASMAIVAGLFVLGWARGEPLLGLFLTAVSLAVAAVPEGLPAIVTVALAIGVRRMAARKALIRNLPAVETLGSTNVICTDKTGTLTVGQMTVRAAYAGGVRCAFSGEGYRPDGEVTRDGGGSLAPAEHELLRLLARNFAGCTNADVVVRDGEHEAVGDPTEAALVVAAHKLGVRRPAIDAAAPKVGEVPFDSDRKRSSVVRQPGRETLEILVNGSPESVIALCTHGLGVAGAVPLDGASRAHLLEQNGALAQQALRVLACARRDVRGAAAAELQRGPLRAEAVERELTFVGLVGMYDPPRAEAKDAVSRCRAAGVAVVMITGDQPRTAAAIARELGLCPDGARVMSGAELQSCDDEALVRRVGETAVFARVTAAEKLRIVRAWQRRGAVVAMTGDGVNDAPALRGADVGVAMGRSGTEVAKQAADMIVTDDNFASIVAAVEEGRGVYDNIRKTMLFLLGGNAGELLLMAACLLAGLPAPLLPIQILWINLVTDGLPALFLAADPIAPDVMRRAPRPRAAPILDRSFVRTMSLTAVLTAGVALAVYVYGLRTGDERTARTHAFAALVFAELLRSFGCRSETIPVWRMPLRTNAMLAVVVAASFALQIWSHHDPTIADLMETSMLTWRECMAVLLVACVPPAVLELAKVVRKRASASRDAPGGGR